MEISFPAESGSGTMSKLKEKTRVQVDWPETIDEGLHKAEGVVVRSWSNVSYVRLDSGKEKYLPNSRLVQLGS